MMRSITAISDYVDSLYPKFGINKRHEIARLLYEIARREKVAYDRILDEPMRACNNFFTVKAALVRRRYPELHHEDLKHLGPLTQLIDDEGACVDIPNLRLWDPQQVFYERSLRDSDFLHRLKAKLPSVPFEEILSYKEYVHTARFDIATYNQRRKQLFVIQERYDLFLQCPCSKSAQACGYDILNAGIGCAFDCAYCFLQGYVNAPGIVIPGNLDEILAGFPAYHRPGMRLGTGQFTDSLVFDHLTGFSSTMINFFRCYSDMTFELKTKSDQIQNILATPASDNIVISWSLNPPEIIQEAELLTATLPQRLEAARQCVSAGYHVGFHFDPIIYYAGWEKAYQGVVDLIFEKIQANQISWISLGCLRMTVKLRQTIERRFPETRLLDAPHIIGFDDKLRYPSWLRQEIYTRMFSWIHQHSRSVPVYLCMEDREMNRHFGVIPFSQKRGQDD
ncbi:MAG TPA: hypothetical protein VLJ10_00055 [Candidatus Bathyarchaeia archaeon]|nr:hypothetical protein [Candidatus Bathyarchaeia archaeon]